MLFEILIMIHQIGYKANVNKPVYTVFLIIIFHLKYDDIHNDSELLSACGFSEDEIKTVLDYLKDFKFDENRNETRRGNPSPGFAAHRM